MARAVTPLTDPKYEAAKPRAKDYTLFDGQGLFLLVKATGTKVWRFKYKKPSGKPGLATLGNYPALTLKAARARRADALELLTHDQDPIESAKQAKIEAASEAGRTFEAVVREWHASMAGKTRSMWTIPGERAPIEGVKRSHRGAKMGTAHLVPLSRQTLEVLEQIYRLSGRFELLLPGDHYPWRPMSENPKRTSIDDRFR
jgi:hypothetical protein